MNQHLEFQINLAGAKLGANPGGGGGSGSGSGDLHRNEKIPTFVGDTPNDIPDIGTMIPIEKI